MVPLHKSMNQSKESQSEPSGPKNSQSNVDEEMLVTFPARSGPSLSCRTKRSRMILVAGIFVLLIVLVVTSVTVHTSPGEEADPSGGSNDADAAVVQYSTPVDNRSCTDRYGEDSNYCLELSGELKVLYPNCRVPGPESIGDGECDGGMNNIEACGWDGGDCNAFNEWKKKYPDCNVWWPSRLGDGDCDSKEYMSPSCNFDDGDCIEYKDLILKYPDCAVWDIEELGDGRCDGEEYMTEECGYDDGDCLEFIQKYPDCHVPRPDLIGDGNCDADESYDSDDLEEGYDRYESPQCLYDGGDCESVGGKLPGCIVEDPDKLGDGECDSGPYMSEACDFDMGDCSDFVAKYPMCKDIRRPWKVGDGHCDNDWRREYNNPECLWDGGDCEEFNSLYPDCEADDVEDIDNGQCDSPQGYGANTSGCGWEGGDCIEFNSLYPDCEGRHIGRIGNGVCDDTMGDGVNTLECGWDGGDCIDFNDKYPDCDVWAPVGVGDGHCDGGEYTSLSCGFDGGDCLEYMDLILKYPDCEPYGFEDIGNGRCDEPRGDGANTLECGWDGGDCIDFNRLYPNCDVRHPYRIGDGYCDGDEYDVEECGYDGTDCLCPDDPLKGRPGICGCGVPDTDSDNDGVPDCIDNCPSIFNPDQEDEDEDGIGDGCDNCPSVFNPRQRDRDGDGIGEACGPPGPLILPPKVEISFTDGNGSIISSGPAASICVNPGEPFTGSFTFNGMGGTKTSSPPKEVVFAIDTSGSMRGKKIEATRDAANAFLSLLDNSVDMAGVVLWSGFLGATQALTDNFAMVRKTFLEFNGGDTNLDLGLGAAVDLLDDSSRPSSSAPSSKAIIFLSDGDGKYTDCTKKSSPAFRAKSKGYAIYSIGLGNAANHDPLIDMSECTGGTKHDASTLDVMDIFKQINQDVLDSSIPRSISISVLPAAGESSSFKFVSPLPPGSTESSLNNIDSGKGLSARDDSISFSFEATVTDTGSDVPFIDLAPSSTVSYVGRDGRLRHEKPLSSMIRSATVDVNEPPIARCATDLTLTSDEADDCLVTVTAEDIDYGSSFGFECGPNKHILSVDKSSARDGDGITLTITDSNGLSDTCSVSLNLECK